MAALATLRLLALGTLAGAARVLKKRSRGSAGGVAVVYGSDQNTCPSGTQRITSEMQCRAAMEFLDGRDRDGYNGAMSEFDWPKGCYACSSAAKSCTRGVWFNPHETGGAQTGARPICQSGFDIVQGGTIFVGDSDIDYWQSSKEAAPGSYNLGIGGYTCNDNLGEIDAILAAFAPTKVVLVCGENDLAYGANVAKTFKRWQSLVEKMTAAGARVVMLGTKPEPATTNLHTKYMKYDERIRAYVRTQAQGCGSAPKVSFVDVFPAFVSMGNPNELYDPNEAPNYLHLGPGGYALWDQWARLALEDARCKIWLNAACAEAESCAPAS